MSVEGIVPWCHRLRAGARSVFVGLLFRSRSAPLVFSGEFLSLVCRFCSEPPRVLPKQVGSGIKHLDRGFVLCLLLQFQK
jgi:hypothetical protein